MDFKVDIRNGKKLWLKPNEYKNGIKYALENNIKALFLIHDETEKYYTLDFSWLKELPEIDELEFMIPLSRQSNIDSIYELNKLKTLTYHNYDRLPLDHTRLKSLEYLYTAYSKNHKNKENSFETLDNLKDLKLWHIKDEENCIFLGNIKKLQRLELTWSRSLKTLDGIEKYKLLESILLINLSQLEDITVLLELKKLKGIWVENCKRLNKEGRGIIEKVRNNK
jgi:hypothetical protein